MTRTGSVADLRRPHIPTYLQPFSGFDVLGGLPYEVETGEYSGLCTLLPRTGQLPNKMPERIVFRAVFIFVLKYIKRVIIITII